METHPHFSERGNIILFQWLREQYGARDWRVPITGIVGVFCGLQIHPPRFDMSVLDMTHGWIENLFSCLKTKLGPWPIASPNSNTHGGNEYGWRVFCAPRSESGLTRYKSSVC